MANDLIAEGHNANPETDDQRKHMPNPQEESFEEGSSSTL